MPQLQQCQVLNPLCWARDQTLASAETWTTAVGFLTHCAIAGTPWGFLITWSEKDCWLWYFIIGCNSLEESQIEAGPGSLWMLIEWVSAWAGEVHTYRSTKPQRIKHEILWRDLLSWHHLTLYTGSNSHDRKFPVQSVIFVHFLSSVQQQLSLVAIDSDYLDQIYIPSCPLCLCWLEQLCQCLPIY